MNSGGAPRSPLPRAGGAGGGPVDKTYTRPTARARERRADATDAERKLWHALSARKVGGVRFNHQVPVGPFIADFVARSLKPVIEVDGGQHASQTEADAKRTRYLEARGFRVIRFWNNDVLENLDGVVEMIARTVADLPSPDPSRKREGSIGARPAAIFPPASREGDLLNSPPAPREGSGEGLSTQPSPRPRTR